MKTSFKLTKEKEDGKTIIRDFDEEVDEAGIDLQMQDWKKENDGRKARDGAGDEREDESDEDDDGKELAAQGKTGKVPAKLKLIRISYVVLLLLALCILGYILSVIAYHTIVKSREQTSMDHQANWSEEAVSENQVDSQTMDDASMAENELFYADYLLPESSDSYLSKADLSGLTKAQLEIAKNEIYARHGLIFTEDEFAEYFESCNWYHGTVNAVTEDMLNNYEKANIALIIELENE